jgi:hypothetical protein
MSARWEPIAAAYVLTLLLGTAASQLPAQVARQSMLEARSGPVQLRSAPPWRFVAWQSEGIILSKDSSSPQPVSFSMRQAPSRVQHKSPFLAWFLSFLVPGGGQGYNGQWGKAAAFFGGAVVGLVVANQETCDSFSFCSGPGFWLFVASSVGSQIDAPITAAAINKRAKEEAFRLPQTALIVATIHF